MMSSCDNGASAHLKIMQGYGKLLDIPLVAQSGRSVALERVGDCEISMFETLGPRSPGAPLFWMELFDLREHSSLDSCGCYNLTEAAAAFDAFAAQAGDLTEASED